MKRLIERLGLDKPRTKGYQAVTTVRLYVLFISVILLFVVLIGRLAHMQLVNQDFYDRKLATASKTTVTNSAVRGQIYDAKGKPLVDNSTYQAVVFTRSNQMTASTIKEMAQTLPQLVSVSKVKLKERDKVDYYLADAETYAQVVESLPNSKKYDETGNSLPESKIYANAVKSVAKEELDFTAEEEKAIELFSQMNAAANFETVTLVTDELTATQIAQLATNSDGLEGIDVKTAWQREVLPTSLASVIGRVSTEQTGLPEEEADYYLSKGYSLNDRVGTSYLEKQYETYLQGSREVKDVNLDKHGNIESIKTVSKGRKGKNLKLTVDLDFQTGVNDILRSYFEAELASGSLAYSEGIYAVVLDPSTGAVLAMSGYDHKPGSGQVKENSLGTITNVFVPGSVVKAATISAGWESGAITGNQVLTDQPISFGGSSPITSWFTVYGSRDISAVQALQYSSNTYMVQVALKMMGHDYDGSALSDEDLQPAMEKLRGTFADYGLGVQTGIDLPQESAGYTPKEYTVGNYLTNAFGQFDNYTPMQLAQYAATVANGGQRIAPHIVEGIYANDEEGNLGEKLESIQTQTLNKVNISDEDMALLKEGFYQVVHGGDAYTTGRSIAEGEAVSIAAKTGTAETFVTDGSGTVHTAVNTNVVSYAPSDNPKIAVAVVLPNSLDLNTKTSHYVTRDIINLYHQLYPMN